VDELLGGVVTQSGGDRAGRLVVRQNDEPGWQSAELGELKHASELSWETAVASACTAIAMRNCSVFSRFLAIHRINLRL
jgi:hypothetical protein